MEKSIYKYILSHTRRQQLWLIVITLASMPLVYYSLEIPKLIINKAIGGGGGAAAFTMLGFGFTQVQYLMLLSSLFLLMVIINGGMKYYINVYRGVLGERMLRRFRYTLYYRILRFPLPHFKNVSSGEIIPMVTAETEPLGGFIGDSIALPVMQGGLLITYLSFIFVQDFWLGLAAIALYPPQIYLIPRLQHQVNLLSKHRVQTVRKLSDRVGESVEGIGDIHANDTSHYERADISGRLGVIFGIRKEIYQRKFFIKFLNNFLAQLTPFFFYSIGGYLVLKNSLSLGALVAVLAAYKDISPPWKELLKFYQITEDVRVKYAQIIEQFAPSQMMAPALLAAPQNAPQVLRGEVRAQRLRYVEDAVATVDELSFSLTGDRHSAIYSVDGGAGDETAQLLARLISPTAGAVHIGEAELHALPEAVTGRRIGYCSAVSRVFNTTIGDNLYYGLKHQPLPPPEGATPDMAAQATRRRDVREATFSGNSTQDINADWVDIGAAGAADAEEFTRITHRIIECVELDDELLTLALRTSEEIDIPPQLAAQIVTLRTRIIEQINDIESGTIIEPLDATRYIENLTVEENLLFGAPVGGVSAADFLATHPLARDILRSSGLQDDFCEIGLELARLMVELFSDVPDDSELFDQFSFITAADLPEYRGLVGQAEAGGVAALTAQQRERLSAVSFKLCPARHRLELVTPPLRDKVLAVRKTLMAAFAADDAHIRFFDRNRYNPAISVQENLLFGKIMYAKGHLQPRITETIKSTLKGADLHQAIIRAGLSCMAGSGGAKLSPAFREKLVIARALLKDPDILIVNNALAGLDNKSFARIAAHIMELRRERNLIWVINDPSLLGRFDHVLILEDHKLAHSGTPQSLAEVIKLL